MKIRFCTSLAGDGFSYVEGETRELPDPLPQRFLYWLRQGLVEAVKDDASEIALAPAAVEYAIARRGRTAGKRRTKKAAAADGEGGP